MSSIESSSLVLSIGVAATAVLLVFWQVLERSSRPHDPGRDDSLYFYWQDVRRGVVALIMLVLAAGIFVGSRMPPGVAGRPNLLYVETWVGILGLVVALLVFAIFDWTATHRYAARHRRAILDEGLQILRDGIVNLDPSLSLSDERPNLKQEPETLR